jgi:hypothetical protein
MKLPTWKNPNRKRATRISYMDSQYTKYYDLDLDDFEHLVTKLKEGDRLSDAENDRYGIYILTMCLICLEGPKFKNKPYQEKEGILEQQYFELLSGLTMFNPHKGKIYSYAYRIAYTAAIHFYTNSQDFNKKQKAIQEHCQEELMLYLDEYSTHKVNTQGNIHE